MAFDVAVGFVIIGACIWAVALAYAGRLIVKQPLRLLRYSWVALAGLTLLCSVAYIAYASIRWAGNTRFSDLGVPLDIFGACFVLALSALVLVSAQGVRRLTVLENENITDSLMGIPNYRHFVARLNEEVTRSNRYQLPLSLIMIDVDYLKNINDTYGNAVGDLVLIALAKLVLSVARDTDITARYARGEIAVIAPNTTAAQAATCAERISQAVETASLLPAEVGVGGNEVGVTVSIGVSSLGPHIRNAQALIVGANAALLKAKHGRRNRIAVS